MAAKDKEILLVEDNPDDVELTLRAFRRNNVRNTIRVVSDGRAAVDYLFGGDGAKSPPSLPAVILLDINMPQMNGLEVLERIRGNERTRRVPVVVLTSSVEERDLLAAYNTGANSYVRKPVDFSEFVEAAGRIGSYWLIDNVPPTED
jgi:two-component system response regulator